MKISIVTPSYNCEKYLEQCFESMYQQNFEELEHILIDGLSDDNTVEIAQKFPLKEIISERDNGQSDAINKGLRRVSGDILAWQNADDLYQKDTFKWVSNFFQQNPEVDLIYGSYIEIDSKGDQLCIVKTKPWSFNKFKWGRFCPVQPTVFWRRSVTDKVGLLNENLHYCMDVDFYSRVVAAGFNVKGVDKVLGSFRVHNESKTQNSANKSVHKKEYLKVLSTHFDFNIMDSFFFQLFYYRSQLATKVKRSFGI